MPRSVVPILLAAFLALSPADLVTFALRAFRNDPEVQIEDAYKWLFHALRGGEHALRDEGAARAWLDREWETLSSPRAGESLVVPLRPDGALVRLNLRPFKASGGRKEELLEAFVRSARTFRAESRGFEEAWNELGHRLESAPSGHLDAASWSRLDAEARAKGFPAWHHSAAFDAARRPAYRVLTGDEARRLSASLPAKPGSPRPAAP